MKRKEQDGTAQRALAALIVGPLAGLLVALLVQAMGAPYLMAGVGLLAACAAGIVIGLLTARRGGPPPTRRH